LTYVREEKAEGPDVRCWVQGSPARQLPNLKRVPQLLVVGEASSAASTNRCVNELEIAAFIADWLQDKVEKGIQAPATR
jgi:hypothetical protein